MTHDCAKEKESRDVSKYSTVSIIIHIEKVVDYEECEEGLGSMVSS